MNLFNFIDNVPVTFASNYSNTIAAYVDQSKVGDSIMDCCPTVLYLIDLRAQRYLFIGKSIDRILGIPSTELIDKGLNYYYSRIHEDDGFLLLNFVFPKFRTISRLFVAEKIKKIRFAFNYRFMLPDKKEIQILDKIQILETDDAGKPILLLGILTDISDFKEDISVTATIHQQQPSGQSTTLMIEHFKGVQQHIFTAREMDIMSLLTQGYSSKEIAEKLFISSQTVDKHRKNMLAKYSKKNVRELIHYVLQQGWVSV